MSRQTLVPNVLFDNLLPNLKPAELKVLLVIIRKTIGWRKDRDWITISQFSKLTGLSRKAISCAITSLGNKGLIKLSNLQNDGLCGAKNRKKSTRTFYALNPSLWRKSTHSKVLSSKTPSKKIQPSRKKVHTTKETNTKENLQRIREIKAELKARWGKPSQLSDKRIS